MEPPVNEVSTEVKEVFRLLDLPMELVSRILKLSVIRSSKEKPITLRCVFAKSKALHGGFTAIVPGEKDRLGQPCITKVCRILRDEGLHIFYGHNTCLLDISALVEGGLWDWLGHLTKTQRSDLKLFFQLYLRCECGILRRCLEHFASETSRGFPGQKFGMIETSGKVKIHVIGGESYCQLALDGTTDENLYDFKDVIKELRGHENLICSSLAIWDLTSVEEFLL